MSAVKCRIGVVAPGSRMLPEVVERVQAVAASLYPDRTTEIVFHPQCFASHGHFAGEDSARVQALVEFANDERFDAVWFGRGGYGACRVIEAALDRLAPAARRKTYLGYSDAGAVLAALYRAGFARVAHGPMAQDVLRRGGEAAITRALRWLVDRASDSLEPTVCRDGKTAAFNMTVLSHIIGTPLQPDLDGHVLMLEEVGEALYRIDRLLFHITSQPTIRHVAGLRLGRCNDIMPNDPEFAMTDEEVARDWCRRSGIAWLGRADIGHDADNKIVPFGAGPSGAQ